MRKKKFFSPQDNYLDIYMSIYADSLEDENGLNKTAREIDFDFTNDIVPDSTDQDFYENGQISKDCFFEDIDYLCAANQIPLDYFDFVDHHLILIYSNGSNLFLGIRARLAEKAVISKLKNSGYENVTDLNWITANNYLRGCTSLIPTRNLREHIHGLSFDIQATLNGTPFKYDVKSAWGDTPFFIKSSKSYANIVLVRFSRKQTFELSIIGAVDTLSLRCIQARHSSEDEYIELSDSLFTDISTNKRKAAS